jgi:hypothetical protein
MTVRSSQLVASQPDLALNPEFRIRLAAANWSTSNYGSMRPKVVDGLEFWLFSSEWGARPREPGDLLGSRWVGQLHEALTREDGSKDDVGHVASGTPILSFRAFSPLEREEPKNPRSRC